MTERIEQRYCIKFCQKLGDSQSQTIRKIQQVFGEDAMGVTQIKEWFNRFKDGRTSAESEQRCGRPQTARSAAVVERVRNLVMADRRLTVREIAEEVGVSKHSAHAILRDDLNMNRVAAKFVPKLLSPEQKDLRRDVAQDLLDTANTDPGFLNTVKTGDESWVYGYDPETKGQSSQWKHPESPRPKKARQVRSKIKVMLTVFFDVRGIVHHEYAPEGQTVTKEYYHDVLRRLRDAVRRKRPDMWTANNWHLHHDNAPAHSSQLIHTFLARHGITTVRQPPYSPDLAPCDFWLFPKLKTPLKGSRFESREEILRNATTELNTIPKEDFQRCFRQWKDRFGRPQVDVSSTCEELNTKIKSTTLNEAARCSAEVELVVHKRRAKKIYNKLQSVTELSKNDPKVSDIVFDFMKDLPLPLLPVQEMFYLRKFWYYVFNVHDLKTGQSVFYNYSEGEAKKGPNERRIAYVPEKLPSKYGVHSEEYLPIRTVTPVVAGM
ncbi:hypothetical protein ANN_11741 [Periplaneta americana]|uniref:Mos1 transposase HTH domain-containing protein n=1 Tax=Periplaneta americana TaxID=6978 RepID=A0ABQ8T5X2_PERAM|nr:hypothetical protein ANN_11741 [Periplaneta americana]